MEHDAAYELYVIVHHIPFQVIAAGEPMVGIDGLVAFDAHKAASLCGEIAVHLGRGHFHGASGGAGEPRCGLAQGGEHHGQVLVEFVFYGVEYLFLMFVYLVPERLATVERQCLDVFLRAAIASSCGDTTERMSARTPLILSRSPSLLRPSISGARLLFC